MLDNSVENKYRIEIILHYLIDVKFNSFTEEELNELIFMSDYNIIDKFKTNSEILSYIEMFLPMDNKLINKFYSVISTLNYNLSPEEEIKKINFILDKMLADLEMQQYIENEGIVNALFNLMVKLNKDRDIFLAFLNSVIHDNFKLWLNTVALKNSVNIDKMDETFYYIDGVNVFHIYNKLYTFFNGLFTIYTEKVNVNYFFTLNDFSKIITYCNLVLAKKVNFLGITDNEIMINSKYKKLQNNVENLFEDSLFHHMNVRIKEQNIVIEE